MSEGDLLFTFDEALEKKPDGRTSLTECEMDLFRYEKNLANERSEKSQLYIRGKIGGMITAIQNIHRFDKPTIEGPF